MLPFDPGSEPRDLVRALLALPDPVPALQAWEEVAPEQLAPVLHALAAELREKAHPVLRALPLDLSLGERSIHLDLLLLPSIFEPEAWGMCFLEGLLRKAPREYRGKRIVELGTGSGWVALALLRFMEIEEVLGVDLNPQAVLVSRLNAILNGYDAEGREQPDRLASRFRSSVSDLLSAPRETGFRADLVIGCIPQVIAPAADLDSSQGLYDLSNYFVAQGLVEDQFGLGLNARALREALHLLEPDGTVVLNLAGRPGAAAVERMFRRRGFEPTILWRTRVQQASDTDIGPLVELEARTGSPFAFHLRRHSPEPVSARVAQAALEGGRPIFHELQVIEGRPRSEALFALAQALGALRLEELWEQVDLSAASDEQLAFVTRLAEGFAKDPRAPYTHEAGDEGFRRKVTDFLQKFHSLALSPHEAFAAPSRPELLHALLLALCAPGDRVVLSASLQPACGAALAKFGADPVWVHDDGEEVADLLPLLKPRLVVVASPRSGLDRLLARCAELDILLALDESERFVIGSRAPENAGLAFLSRNPGSPHLAVLVGLIHSQAFPDVELALLFSRHPKLMGGLEVAAELSYSRLSCFHQAYYDSLFDELLSFRVNDQEASGAPAPQGGPRLSAPMEALQSHPAFSRPAPAQDVIRLDFGENELALPRRLQAGILRGFLAPPQPGAATRPQARHAAANYLRATRLPDLKDEQVVLGMGTQPLLSDALRVLARSLGRHPVVLVPQGSYGLFPPLVEAVGCTVKRLAAEAPGFLASVDAVRSAGPFDALLLAHPANPSGAAYAPSEVEGLAKLAAERGAKLILDEVFGLLADLDGPAPFGQDRWRDLSGPERESLMVLCGVSKEFAAGGLRLGLAASADQAWLEAMEALHLDPLPVSVQVAVETLFGDLAAWRSELEAHRGQLARNRHLLLDGLRSLGFGVAAEGGGLFLFPDAAPLGKDAEALALDLEAKARVRLNTPSWSGTSTHLRACYALPEPRLKEAISRLRACFSAAGA